MLTTPHKMFKNTITEQDFKQIKILLSQDFEEIKVQSIFPRDDPKRRYLNYARLSQVVNERYQTFEDGVVTLSHTRYCDYPVSNNYTKEQLFDEDILERYGRLLITLSDSVILDSTDAYNIKYNDYTEDYFKLKQIVKREDYSQYNIVEEYNQRWRNYYCKVSYVPRELEYKKDKILIKDYIERPASKSPWKPKPKVNEYKGVCTWLMSKEEIIKSKQYYSLLSALSFIKAGYKMTHKSFNSTQYWYKEDDDKEYFINHKGKRVALDFYDIEYKHRGKDLSQGWFFYDDYYRMEDSIDEFNSYDNTEAFVRDLANNSSVNKPNSSKPIRIRANKTCTHTDKARLYRFYTEWVWLLETDVTTHEDGSMTIPAKWFNLSYGHSFPIVLIELQRQVLFCNLLPQEYKVPENAHKYNESYDEYLTEEINPDHIYEYDNAKTWANYDIDYDNY